jgi:hypothetical protein
MLLVDFDQAVFDLAERGVQDEAQYAPLVVLEEGRQGVRTAAKEAIDETHDFGQIRLGDGGAAFLLEVFESGEVLRGGTLDRGGYVVIAEMKGGEGHLLLLFGEVGADAAAANGKTRSS